jgi:hypothetical protein
MIPGQRISPGKRRFPIPKSFLGQRLPASTSGALWADEGGYPHCRKFGMSAVEARNGARLQPVYGKSPDSTAIISEANLPKFLKMRKIDTESTERRRGR